MEVLAVQYNYLGNSGLKVSNMCYGGNTFGVSAGSARQSRPGNLNEEETHILLDRFAELGGNFIDTSNVYTAGDSEKIIGSWLAKQKREKYVVATKVGLHMDRSDPNMTGLTRRHIMDAVDISLQRLGTDYIDLYQMHSIDRATPLEETLTALSDLVNMGKVRYLGACNATGWRLQKMAEIAKYRNLNPIVSLQAQYNLMLRGIELELTDVCINEGIGLITWSPLKGGWLSGKIKKGMTAPPEGSRVAWASEDPENRGIPSNPPWQKWATERTWKILGVVEEVSKQTGKSMAQVSLRWLLQKPAVTSVIFGAKNMSQLNDNMGAGRGWELTQDNMSNLDKASSLNKEYPYDFVDRHLTYR